MGIQHLNRHLRNKCQNEIKQIHLSELKDKKIAIDASIYMYRYVGEGGLIDGTYQLISLLRHYEIKGVFVFDGVAPPEKQELLQMRKASKNEAERKYNDIKERLGKCSKEEALEIRAEMDVLKKKFIRLKNKDIEKVKDLIRICGMTYYEADGEADQLCAKLVLDNKVYACLSEDMDMFVYGCSRVLRYLSLLNSTVVIYDFNAILNKLQWTDKEFREICVLSGSDYNVNKTRDTNLFKTIKLFEKYKNYINDDNNNNNNDDDNNNSNNDDNDIIDVSNNTFSELSFEFYQWLKESTDYIKDYSNLISTILMFDLSNLNIQKFVKQQIINSPINQVELRRFLYDYDFIFV